MHATSKNVARWGYEKGQRARIIEAGPFLFPQGWQDGPVTFCKVQKFYNKIEFLICFAHKENKEENTKEK